jgi:hypothetical protein
MTTSDSALPGRPPHPAPLTVDDLFDASEPVRNAEDLARNGVFDDGEVGEFLADLYAMRRSDVA